MHHLKITRRLTYSCKSKHIQAGMKNERDGIVPGRRLNEEAVSDGWAPTAGLTSGDSVDPRKGSLGRSYYRLEIQLSPALSHDVVREYRSAAIAHNATTAAVLGGNVHTFDAGFDLYCPRTVKVLAGELGRCIGHGVKCRMVYVKSANRPVVAAGRRSGVIHPMVVGSDMCVGYYLYPRSSTGVKTPLRLANSIGIIDSGYRGNLIAAFDNKADTDYTVVSGQRLVQLCPPNLTYPILVKFVDNLDSTVRGCDGFGSTGK